MIRYRAGYKYQLADPYALNVGITPKEPVVTPFICLSERGNLYINGGYAWDGATGFPDIPSIMRASLVHDALYQLMRLGYLPVESRPVSDDVFRRVCLSAGMPSLLAAPVYRGVRLFGGPAADPLNARPVLVAP